MAKRKSSWKSFHWTLLLLTAVALAFWFALHKELLTNPSPIGATEEAEAKVVNDPSPVDPVKEVPIEVPRKDTRKSRAKDALDAPAPPPTARDGARDPGCGLLTIALAAELKQLDGVLVVINSAMKNANDSSKLQFRILTTEEDAPQLLKKVKERLPSPKLNLQTVNFEPWYPRVGKLLGGKSSARKELFDALNFAAFYLHEVLLDVPGGRVLYLDTDVVVQGDLTLLASMNMRGHPAAAAEDCAQKIGKYVDVDRVKSKTLQSELPHRLYATKKGCVINRGVVLVDLEKWKSQNITGAIEDLVRLHLTKGKGPLWRAGVSQPPFLIALAGKFVDLGAEYNVRGLGRGDIAPEEVDFYKKKKLWDPYFDKFLYKCKFHCCPGCAGWALSPYISALAQKAKILHFNGRLKPSRSERRDLKQVEVPKKGMPEDERAAREQRPLCSCGNQCVQECAGIWWAYLPPE